MSEYTPNLNAAIIQFKDFGLSLDVAIPDNPTLDGSSFSRCPLVSKPRANTDGAYKLHTDGRPAGIVWNHSTGIQETWKYDDPDYVPIQLTPEQHEQQAKEQRQNKELREKELADKHAEAAKKALFIWNQSKPLTDNQSHEYLIKKSIKGVYSIRVNHYQGNTSLVIPVGKDGAFSTLQFISPDGIKTFLKGGKKSGCYSILNKMESPRYVAIGEGFGTVATILDDGFSQEKGVMGVMALDAGNLEAVAVAMREKYPTVDIFIFGDKGDKDDKGEKSARAAAKACGGYCVLPPIAKGDFNDYLTGDNVTVSLFDLMMQAANATDEIEIVEINQHTTETPSNAPTVENGSVPPITQTTHNATLDDTKHYCTADFLSAVNDDHLLKQLALSIADATSLPIHTVFLMGLGR
jgi:putative DNA primase/helicase